MAFTMAPATESIMGSLPRDKAGVGSAVNDTTRQVGGALGVAIIGSVYSSIYASQIVTHLNGMHLSAAQSTEVSSSIGGALEQAAKIGGPTGHALADAAKSSFVTGMHHGVIVGAAVAFVGAVIALVFLPARAPEAADEGISPDEPNVFGLVEGEAGDLIEEAEAAAHRADAHARLEVTDVRADDDEVEGASV